MRNSKKINRNHWSNEELATLHQCVHQAKKVNTGLANAAKKLGRTQAACTFKYYKTNTAVTSAAVAPKMHNVVQTLTFKIKSWSIEDGQLKVEIYKEA